MVPCKPIIPPPSLSWEFILPKLAQLRILTLMLVSHACPPTYPIIPPEDPPEFTSP